MPSPKEIRRIETNALFLRWDDGQSTELSSEVLRKNCPCATCKEARGDGSHSSPISPAQPVGRKALLRVLKSASNEELRLDAVRLVGNYAVSLTWGDGHDTGIYPFALLHQLAQNQ